MREGRIFSRIRVSAISAASPHRKRVFVKPMAVALHRLGDDLSPDKLTASGRHGKTDGSHPAVKIQHRILRPDLCKFRGGAVQHFSRRCVDLKEGKRIDLHRNTADLISYKPGPAQYPIPQTQNGTFSIRIDVQDHRCYLREQFPNPLCGFFISRKTV